MFKGLHVDRARLTQGKAMFESVVSFDSNRIFEKYVNTSMFINELSC